MASNKRNWVPLKKLAFRQGPFLFYSFLDNPNFQKNVLSCQKLMFSSKMYLFFWPHSLNSHTTGCQIEKRSMQPSIYTSPHCITNSKIFPDRQDLEECSFSVGYLLFIPRRRVSSVNSLSDDMSGPFSDTLKTFQVALGALHSQFCVFLKQESVQNSFA